jgi:SCP-2 sterol transfer family
VADLRTIRQRAEPDKAISAVVEFRITGRRDGGIDRYQLTLTGGRCRTSTRGTRRPALTLELEPVAFLRLVGGTASAQRLLITGKLKLRGDLMLAYPPCSGFPGVARKHRCASVELWLNGASDGYGLRDGADPEREGRPARVSVSSWTGTDRGAVAVWGLCVAEVGVRCQRGLRHPAGAAANVQPRSGKTSAPSVACTGVAVKRAS